MKHLIRLLIMDYLLLALFSSCSIQKRLSYSARKVIKDSSLLNAHIGISIFEPAAGKYWYNFHGDKYFVPASNTKIPTCYAGMKYLGDSLVGLQYHISNERIIYIRGTADPSFLHTDFTRQPVYDFLKKFQTIKFTGELFDDFLGNGWSWNDYKEAYMAQRSDFPLYGNIARISWKNKEEVDITPSWFSEDAEVLGSMENGFHVDRPWETNIFQFRNGTNKLKLIPFYPHAGLIMNLLADTLQATVEFDPFNVRVTMEKIHSQLTDSVLRPMMHRSDNFFAEQTLLMVSDAKLGVMNDQKIIDTLLKTDFIDLPQPPRWVDGSGLSRYNLFTPQDFVAILHKMIKEFPIGRIKDIFPTGGEGTLSNYYKADSNYIYAKTGTLSGVVAFSGFLYTRKNKLLLFSVLVNNHRASATAVRRSVEKFLKGIRNKY